MTNIPISPSTHSPAQTPIKRDSARFFYSGCGILMLLLVIWGFQDFYLRGKAYPDRPIAPPIRTLVILHGIAMAGWVILFIVQPLLIVNRKHRIHITLGKAGAVLAACIFFLGLKLAVDAARIAPPEMVIWTLKPLQFMAVPFIGMLVFAPFVIAGVWFRKRPEIHRPMMLLALLSAMPAAVGRITPMNNLYQGTLFETIFGPFFSTLVISAILLAIKYALNRKLDRWFAIGLAIMTIEFAMLMVIARTSIWERFAASLVG